MQLFAVCQGTPFVAVAKGMALPRRAMWHLLDLVSSSSMVPVAPTPALTCRTAHMRHACHGQHTSVHSLLAAVMGLSTAESAVLTRLQGWLALRQPTAAAQFYRQW